MNSQHTDKSIYKRQKAPNILQCINAQMAKYARAKMISIVHFLCSVGLICFCSIVNAVIGTDLWLRISMILTSTLLFVNIFLEQWKKKTQQDAAEIQQHIDVTLFATSEYQDCWGELPSQQRIAELVAYKSKNEKTRPIAWYADYSKLPHHEQVIHCQAENVRWTRNLAREYLLFVNICFGAFCLLFFSLEMLIWSPSFITVVSTITWFFPLLQFVIVLNLEIKSSGKKLQLIQAKIDAILSNKNEWDSWGWEKREIEIQHSIYELRKNGVMVPNWFYCLKKEKYERIEQQMSKIMNKLQ